MYNVENVNGKWVVKAGNVVLNTLPTENQARSYAAYMVRMDRLDNA
jgi:hypothetical protein